MDNSQPNNQIKVTVTQTRHKFREHVDTLMTDPLRQGIKDLRTTGEYTNHAAGHSSMSRTARPQRTLEAGRVIPWQNGFQHLNLEHQE